MRAKKELKGNCKFVTEGARDKTLVQKHPKMKVGSGPKSFAELTTTWVKNNDISTSLGRIARP